MTRNEESEKVDKWLSQRGVKFTISDLYHVPVWGREFVPQLLELLKTPLSPWMTKLVANALFARKPNALQKRTAVDHLFQLIKSHAGNANWDLPFLTYNYIRGNVSVERVHEIGQMVLSPKFGELRDTLAHVLGAIRSAEAVPYLLKAAEDPETAVGALDNLVRKKVPGVERLCEAAIRSNQIDKEAKETIREIYARFKKRATNPAHLQHLTKKSIPKGLEEWSENIDEEELHKRLNQIGKALVGFGAPEIAAIEDACASLRVDETKRLKFDIGVKGESTEFWVEAYCDDIGAFDIYVFGPTDLIKILGQKSKPSPRQ